MKIHLHVGAHKTGTTFIQNCLAANRATLNRGGIGYLPLREQRAIHSALKNVSPSRFDFPSFASSFFAGESSDEPVGIIISDENLIGSCYSLVVKGEFYPDAAQRLHELGQLLRGHDVTLFFSIRSYDSFLASAFSEVMRNRNLYVPLVEFKRRLALESCRWPRLLAGLAEALQTSHLVVWRFEDLPANVDAVLRRLAFDIHSPLPPPSRGAVRPSMSQTAFDVLSTIAERQGPDIAGRMVKRVHQDYPKGREHPAFDPWTEAEKAELRGMYRADCLDLPVPLWQLPGTDLPRPAKHG